MNDINLAELRRIASAATGDAAHADVLRFIGQAHPSLIVSLIDRLARVEALHPQSDVLSGGGTVCVYCGTDYPCETIRAVADEQEAVR